MSERLTESQRHQIILDILKEGPSTFKNICDEIGDFDERTIRRDIKKLKTAGAKITDFKENGRTKWKLSEPYRLPNTFSSEDILYLTIIRQALEGYPGKYLQDYFKDLSVRINKISFAQGDYSKKDIDDAVSFRPPPARSVDAAIWQTLLDSILKKQPVKVGYKHGKDKVQEQILWPYHITCLEGEWYLLAGSPNDTSVKQHSLVSIDAAETLSGSFEKPENVDPKKMLKKSFGRFINTGDKTRQVSIRIKGFMIKYVQDRIFHPDQQVKELGNEGNLVISFPASADGPVPLGNVASWVLGMGPCAKVLEPPELIERVKQEARELLDLYEEQDPDAPSWH